ncbi:extracellular solute-binding protein [Micromonospora sp. CPCC 206060]|uniref:ABC transporter substrate-binding protein n=1 Tax=Micromonospora sp. CPCC 206060 TaxID=3122406 RepID=UPI002FF062C6
MSATISRRTLLRAFGASAGVAALTACASEGAAPVAGDKAAKEINFYNWSMSEEANKPAWEKLLAAYQSKRPDVKIAPVVYPWTGFLEPMLLAARNGQTFGALQMPIDQLTTFASLGVLEDLGDLAKKNDYTPATLLIGQVDGKQVALPHYSGAIGLFVNQTWLDRIGAKDVPATVTEFEGLLTELKKATGKAPYLGSTKDPALKDLIPWMWTFGSAVYADGRVQVNDEGGVRALEWYKGLLDKGLILRDISRTESRVIFGRGDAALYDDATLARQFLLAAPKGKEVAAVTRPVSRPVLTAGDKPQAMSHGHCVAVFKGKGAETGRQLAEYLTADPDSLKTFFEGTSLPPAATKALQSPWFTSDTYQMDFAEKVTKTASADPFWVLPNFAQVEKVLTDAIGAVLAGREKAKPALDGAATAMQALIKK